jgi:hypothetical protein
MFGSNDRSYVYSTEGSAHTNGKNQIKLLTSKICIKIFLFHISHHDHFLFKFIFPFSFKARSTSLMFQGGANKNNVITIATTST